MEHQHSMSGIQYSYEITTLSLVVPRLYSVPSGCTKKRPLNGCLSTKALLTHCKVQDLSHVTVYCTGTNFINVSVTSVHTAGDPPLEHKLFTKWLWDF